jgi:hypothetical protein
MKYPLTELTFIFIVFGSKLSTRGPRMASRSAVEQPWECETSNECHWVVTELCPLDRFNLSHCSKSGRCLSAFHLKLEKDPFFIMCSFWDSRMDQAQKSCCTESNVLFCKQEHELKQN